MIESVVHLHITSETITSEEILQSLQVHANQIYNAGDYIEFSGGGKKRMPEKKNGLIINSNISRENSMEAHIENILDQIISSKENFIKLGDKIDSFFKIGIYLYEDETTYNHGFYLDKKMMKELADMNIEISYDLYVLEP